MSHNTITGADVQAIAWQADSFGQYANDIWVAEYADTARAAALEALRPLDVAHAEIADATRRKLALPSDYADLGWTCYADAVRGVYDADGADTVGSTDDTEREITDLLESLGYSLDWDNGPMIYDAVRASAYGTRDVAAAAEYWRAYGEVVDGATARAIAAQWQSPGTVGSDLATLASGIRIDRRAAVADVDATLADLDADGVNLDTETPSARGGWTAADYVALHALRAWILAAPSASGTLDN